MKKYIYIASLVFLSACSDNDNIIDERIDDSTCRPADPSCLISSVEDYIDVAENGTEMPATRANMLGTSFEPGDMMRLRITAPLLITQNTENPHGVDRMTTGVCLNGTALMKTTIQQKQDVGTT